MKRKTIYKPTSGSSNHDNKREGNGYSLDSNRLTLGANIATAKHTCFQSFGNIFSLFHCILY